MEKADSVKAVGTAEGKQIGKISHFFPRISVAVIELSEALKVGDVIRIKGKGGKINFTQEVESMQLNHEQINEAQSAEPIGLKVNEKVREGCCVFKL
jgi:putative protease